VDVSERYWEAEVPAAVLDWVNAEVVTALKQSWAEDVGLIVDWETDRILFSVLGPELPDEAEGDVPLREFVYDPVKVLRGFVAAYDHMPTISKSQAEELSGWGEMIERLSQELAELAAETKAKALSKMTARLDAG
jgi:hypothetical protein